MEPAYRTFLIKENFADLLTNLEGLIREIVREEIEAALANAEVVGNQLWSGS
jgi:hypothetical protein